MKTAQHAINRFTCPPHPAAHSDHLVGPLAIVVATCVTAEVIRAGRFLNIGVGLG